MTKKILSDDREALEEAMRLLRLELGRAEQLDAKLQDESRRSVAEFARDFGTGTRGFAASENATVAVCVLPGTELSFADEVRCLSTGLLVWRDKVLNHKTAIFRQINKDKVAAHHDALEFPDGQIVFLTSLSAGQHATVLQLPAEPKTAVESEAQRRAAYVG
jgi:hypothetical protein